MKNDSSCINEFSLKSNSIVIFFLYLFIYKNQQSTINQIHVLIVGND